MSLNYGSPQFFAVTDNSVKEVASHRIPIRSLIWHNDDAAARFLQIFDKASADVTLGTTTPDMVFQLGADTTDSFPFGDSVFEIGFSFAVTTTRTGSTGGTNSDVVVFVS